MKSNIICIYPEDETTSFLLPVYECLSNLPNFVGYRNNTTQPDCTRLIIDALTRADSSSIVVFLGHGASNKLYGSVYPDGTKHILLDDSHIEFFSKFILIYLDNNKPELIILDVSLPDGNGFDLYKSAIKEKEIPVIFLTARDDEDDVIKGLSLGAEDYMTKPFSTKELLVRVKNIILRNNKISIINVKDISFDLNKMIVSKNGKEIDLTSLELKILHLLFNNIGKVVRRNTILDKIWEWTGNDVDNHTITVYLKRIREKLGLVYREAWEELGFTEFNPIHIETYQFESEIEKELVNVFAVVGTYELHPDMDEVDEGRWWDLADIDANLGKGIFTPNFESEFTMIRKPLLALL